MSTASEAPSARAMRQLTNRNNLAELQLHNYLQQEQRLSSVRISEVDKDRLDATSFLTHLKRCDSDLLPQSQRVREDLLQDTGIDDLSDDSPTSPHDHLTTRNTHTAKTAPTPSSRRRGRRERGDHKDGDDRLSLDEDLPHRHTKTGGMSRRQMLCKRHEQDEKAKVSNFDKAELFLTKLRKDEHKGQKPDDFRYHATRKDFVTCLLGEIQGQAGFRKAGADEEEGEEGWVSTRMVYPIKRLGNIATRFKQQGQAPEGDEHRGSLFSPRKKPPDGRRDPGRNRNSNTHSRRNQRPERSVFDITEDDPPSSLLPWPACMPDVNRPRRDLLADVARAFGFGEATRQLLLERKKSEGEKIRPPEEDTPLSPPPQNFNPLSRASIAERRRLQRQAKVRVSVHLKLRAKPAADPEHGPRGRDSVRALLRAGQSSREILEERIKEFMCDLDQLEGKEPWSDGSASGPEED